MNEELDINLYESECEPDSRLTPVTDVEFERQMKKINKELQEEFDKIENERAQAWIDFHNSGDAYVYDT